MPGRAGSLFFSESSLFTLLLDSDDDHLTTEPVAYLHSSGKTLFGEPGDRLVATHENKLWRVGEAIFASITIPAAVNVCFENPETGQKANYGPFEQLRLTDGDMQAGSQFDRVIAQFSDSKQGWVLSGGSETMADVVIRPASEDCDDRL